MPYLHFLLLCLSITSAAYSIHRSKHHHDYNPYLNNNNTDQLFSPLSSQITQRGIKTDPTSFDWIRTWAAIGDSFTAGIGAGSLYSQQKSDYECSRYDRSYPSLLNRMFGQAVEQFQYLACSGDRTMQIYEQVKHLKENTDLVMMTAGGNDLCMSGIIKTCIFLPGSESACQEILDKAQSNIDTFFKSNIESVLIALKDKMSKKSIVIYNKYGQFFNTENEDCGDGQDWSFPNLPLVSGLKLTVERRKKFNNLVININNAIQEVVDKVSANKEIHYQIATADWDPWPREGVNGQFCGPGSTGEYPDPGQPDLQFFKPNTHVNPAGYHDELKRREEPTDPDFVREAEQQAAAATPSGEKWNIYNSLLYKSSDPRAEALHKLNPRDAPVPPNCPGDGGFDWTLGYGLPDRWGQFFHPNMAGHETIAAFALEALIGQRAKQLGVDNPICERHEEFRCFQKDGHKAYANADELNKNYKTYCKEVKVPDHTINWRDERTFNKGTPDEHTFSVRLTDDASEFDRDVCLESFNLIINSCDGNDNKNPMNWKFGGRYVRGATTYQVTPKRDNRPWPPIQKPYGSCKGIWHGLLSSYTLYGAGWSTWDYGQQTLVPSIKGCIGLGLTNWKFEYFDKPDENNMEWKVSFFTPVWVRARCFKNNKVAINSGGFTDGCGGNDV